MAKALGATLVFLVVSLAPQSVMKDWAKSLIIWNVGQGQWLTYIDRSACEHFDMGGERAPISTVIHFCQQARNRLWLSHGDWDHLNYIRKSNLPNLCLASRKPFTKSRQKLALLSGLEACSLVSPKWLSILWSPTRPTKSTNDSSLVLKVGSTLIPGDSTKTQEKFWGKSKCLDEVKTLVLGHHGSRTSTGSFILDRMPALNQAIGSSRKVRYGHPHYEVSERLRKAGVPLITTEDWGSIRVSADDIPCRDHEPPAHKQHIHRSSSRL